MAQKKKNVLFRFCFCFSTCGRPFASSFSQFSAALDFYPSLASKCRVVVVVGKTNPLVDLSCCFDNREREKKKPKEKSKLKKARRYGVA